MSYLSALLYDRMIAHAEWLGLQRHRKEMLAPLGGRILELGAGTGKNLSHYAADVEQLVLTEPDPHMRRRLEANLRPLPLAKRAVLSPAPAEALPFDAGHFDHVVSTLVYCSVKDLRGSLLETARVLARGGTLTLIEHIAAPPGSRRLKWQKRFNPLWSVATNGCHLDRDPRSLLAELGFREEYSALTELRGAPSIQQPLLLGRWRRH